MDARRVDTHFLEASAAPIAFLFPGLGDHYIDMARQLYEYEPLFCEQVDHCADLLLPLLGQDVREVVYPKRRDQHAHVSPPPSEHAEPTLNLRKMLGRGEQQGDEATLRLNRTYLTHPALVVIEYALAQLWMKWGIYPHALFGYSVGEYVAACIAGVFSLQEALTLVAKRARLIQDLPPGMMLAVSLSEQAVQPLLSQDLSLAAINGPDVSVLAGPASAIEDVERQLASMGVSNRRIQTLHAFHSHMMDPIAEEFTQLVSKFQLRPPIIPYISSVTGTWVTDQEATDPHYWAKHLCQTVRFADGISTLDQRANYILLEVGPGQTLGSLARQQLVNQTASEHVILSSVRSAYTNQHDLTFLLQTLGRLWRLGVQIDWVAFYASASSNLWQEASVYDDKSHVAHTSAHPSRRIRPALATTYVAPTSTIEQTITTMWQEVLGFEPIGIYDSFFELGGHSLSAIRLIAHLKKVLQVDISLDIFLAANCIAELAVCVAEMQMGVDGWTGSTEGPHPATPHPRPLRDDDLQGYAYPWGRGLRPVSVIPCPMVWLSHIRAKQRPIIFMRTYSSTRPIFNMALC